MTTKTVALTKRLTTQNFSRPGKPQAAQSVEKLKIKDMLDLSCSFCVSLFIGCSFWSDPSDFDRF